MALTPEQLAIVRNAVLRDCLATAGEDTAAGYEAAEIILAVEPEEWFEEQYHKITAEQAGMRATLAALDKALAGTAQKHADIKLALEM
jgi:hypothetical protein